jgi:hypothetical protein
MPAKMPTIINIHFRTFFRAKPNFRIDALYVMGERRWRSQALIRVMNNMYDVVAILKVVELGDYLLCKVY